MPWLIVSPFSLYLSGPCTIPFSLLWLQNGRVRRPDTFFALRPLSNNLLCSLQLRRDYQARACPCLHCRRCCPERRPRCCRTFGFLPFPFFPLRLLVCVADPHVILASLQTSSTASPRTRLLTLELSETMTSLTSSGPPTTRSVRLSSLLRRGLADSNLLVPAYNYIGGSSVRLPGLQGPEDRSLRRRHHRTRPVRFSLSLL
jgi:hypothetical protein